MTETAAYGWRGPPRDPDGLEPSSIVVTSPRSTMENFSPSVLMTAVRPLWLNNKNSGCGTGTNVPSVNPNQNGLNGRACNVV